MPYRRTITLHLLVDLDAHQFLYTEFAQWQPQDMAIHFYSIELYMAQVQKFASSHYSGSRSYIKLLLPQILPPSVDKVIMLDADMLLAKSVYSLWGLFDQFNDSQGFGYNAGLILLDLNKLRTLNWRRIWEDVYTELADALGGILPTAEQDVLNRIVHLNPKYLFDMPCTWNVQLASFSLAHRCPIVWSFTEEGRQLANASGVRETELMHFNAQFKPEFSYPKPWRTPKVVDDGHVLTGIERARKYFEFYYLLRDTDISCFR
ncbi:unnamed protein product [Echinostoma caproni]|uniref:Glycosyltransferase family 8 protein n=1 Tax=Echinostoma caproni TaxID=27848 RepID=A0A183AKI1_9TREM|nr:unnamed protein product [Echinostoma caproni]